MCSCGCTFDIESTIRTYPFASYRNVPHSRGHPWTALDSEQRKEKPVCYLKAPHPDSFRSWTALSGQGVDRRRTRTALHELYNPSQLSSSKERLINGGRRSVLRDVSQRHSLMPARVSPTLCCQRTAQINKPLLSPRTSKTTVDQQHLFSILRPETGKTRPAVHLAPYPKYLCEIPCITTILSGPLNNIIQTCRHKHRAERQLHTAGVLTGSLPDTARRTTTCRKQQKSQMNIASDTGFSSFARAAHL